MPPYSRSTWLPRWLFRVTLGVSAGLLLAVILSPLLEPATPDPAGWSRLLALFARDGTLRRTALASAAGLTVTACIFFRPDSKPVRTGTRKPPKPPPPANIVGA